RKRGYTKYTNTETFIKGLNKLLTISKSVRNVIMCAEIVWFRYHRRLIAEQLVMNK
ncbi:MAG: DUF488 family protein, partial [Candidatus Thorarchaeota archaeon]